MGKKGPWGCWLRAVWSALAGLFGGSRPPGPSQSTPADAEEANVTPSFVVPAEFANNMPWILLRWECLVAAYPAVQGQDLMKAPVQCWMCGHAWIAAWPARFAETTVARECEAVALECPACGFVTGAPVSGCLDA